MEMIFFLLIIFLSVIAILTGLFWLIYKLFSRYKMRKTGISVIACLILFFAYNIYDAIYPDDDFYFEEFKTAASRDLPSSAKILEKSASYPDFHGDYCSASIIQLSPNDYQKLRNILKNDKRLTKGEIIGSEELTEVMGARKETDIIDNFQNRGNYQDWHYIGFFKDGRTIVVLICKT